MATWSGFRSSSSSTYSYPTQNNGAARSNKQPAKLNKGDLPDTLWCYGCEKEKPISMFSSTQREKVANLNRIARKSAGAAGGKKFQPTCESKLELRCIICGKTKELSGFSKAQRRMAAKDNGARCLKCVELREDLDWADEGTKHNDSDGETYEDDDHSNFPPF